MRNWFVVRCNHIAFYSFRVLLNAFGYSVRELLNALGVFLIEDMLIYNWIFLNFSINKPLIFLITL